MAETIKIRVVAPRTNIASSTQGKSSLFVLEQDRWDDFNFQTQYLLHWVNLGKVTFIGPVKILKRGQVEKDGIQLKPGYLDSLSREFGSLGQSLDYYERIASLEPKQQTFILTALRDVIHSPLIGDSFHGERGWKVSVLRDIKEDDALFTLAPVILTRRYESLPQEDLKFTFTVPGWRHPVKFDFKGPASGVFEPATRLPERIAVLIGRNGSGKSTLLARIARVAYATRSDREQKPLADFGRLDPPGLGFPRILTISYSAFDSFRVPGVSKRDQDQIAKDVDSGTGRFVFCGLRDVVREIKADLKLSDKNRNFLKDRSRRTLLKSVGRLAKEYARTIQRVIERGRVGLTKEAMQSLYNDPSFRDVDEVLNLAFQGSDTKAEFLEWGTGHKIAVQVVLNLTAYTERRSLVLFDEPESHLHPPLLAALMHSVRHILSKTEAFGIVATHSPVVLQETMSRHIHVIRREVDQTIVSSPRIEVFGENIGNVTSEVFELTSEVTDFHKILDYLTTIYPDAESIEKLFDRGLSAQARAYLRSIFAGRA